MNTNATRAATPLTGPATYRTRPQINNAVRTKQSEAREPERACPRPARAPSAAQRAPGTAGTRTAPRTALRTQGASGAGGRSRPRGTPELTRPSASAGTRAPRATGALRVGADNADENGEHGDDRAGLRDPRRGRRARPPGRRSRCVETFPPVTSELSERRRLESEPWPPAGVASEPARAGERHGTQDTNRWRRSLATGGRSRRRRREASRRTRGHGCAEDSGGRRLRRPAHGAARAADLQAERGDASSPNADRPGQRSEREQHERRHERQRVVGMRREGEGGLDEHEQARRRQDGGHPRPRGRKRSANASATRIQKPLAGSSRLPTRRACAAPGCRSPTDASSTKPRSRSRTSA